MTTPSASVSTETESATRDLGREIRRIRSERGLTLLDVANLTGLSVSMLSMLERGRTGVSVGSLVAVSSALGVPVGELFHARPAPGATVIARADQTEITVGAGVNRRLVLADPERGIEIAELHLPPGAHTGDEPVRHEGHEYLTVLEGTLTVEIAGEIRWLANGDALHLDARQLHRFANTSDSSSRSMLVMHRPVGSGHGH
ncbi:helix-turn-helix domain-containing protein [Micromonospora zingiberis]|uniref:helix-turn-helix domain-containing protein n=1 Tax=Micromonospora zingiberis TaxID=2053011 RepID=UPI0013F3A982|nr:XRE family transcriptional regulator [Micromonospora zingiberis]